jgi:hypothetical protein
MATLLALFLNALTVWRKTKPRIRPTPVSAPPSKIAVGGLRLQVCHRERRFPACPSVIFFWELAPPVSVEMGVASVAEMNDRAWTAVENKNVTGEIGSLSLIMEAQKARSGTTTET